MNSYFLPLLIFVSTSLFYVPLDAGYTLKGGKLVNTNEVPTFSAERHYELGVLAMNEEDFKEAHYHFNIVAKNFPRESFGSDSQYFAAVCLYKLKEYDFANEAFTAYIHGESNPAHFEDAIGYKLEIAECFRHGAKKRVMGYKALPKWAPAKTLAVEIYDEVITSLPCHEYAAKALMGKAYLHWDEGDYRECVDAFQALIRRFPRDELALDSYVCINRVYLDQAQVEFQNPDLLALAEINYKRFEKDFPKEERLQDARDNVVRIRELFARGLFETGQFYERKEFPQAAIIYYQSAISKFPDTSWAKCSGVRLEILSKRATEGEASDPSVIDASAFTTDDA